MLAYIGSVHNNFALFSHIDEYVYFYCYHQLLTTVSEVHDLHL